MSNGPHFSKPHDGESSGSPKPYATTHKADQETAERPAKAVKDVKDVKDIKEVEDIKQVKAVKDDANKYKPQYQPAKGSSMPGPRPENLPEPLSSSPTAGTVVRIHWPGSFGLNSPRNAKVESNGGFAWEVKADEAHQLPKSVKVYGSLTPKQRAVLMEDGVEVWAESDSDS